MRQFLCTVALLAGSLATYGQRTEFSVQAGSGLFRFVGSGTGQQTSLDGSADANAPSRAFLPYGQRPAFSIGGTAQLQRVTAGSWLYGLQAGYESLASTIAVQGGFLGFQPVLVQGKAVLRNQFINAHPFVGKRFGNAKRSVDVTAGIDAGIGLRSTQTGDATTSAVSRPALQIREVWAVPAVDYRPRINIIGYYRSYGVSVGYSHGLTNYAKNLPLSGQFEAYSRFWRAGVTYRFSKQAGRSRGYGIVRISLPRTRPVSLYRCASADCSSG